MGKSLSLSKGAEKEASSEGEARSKDPRKEKVWGSSSNQKVTSVAGVLRLRESGQQWWGSVSAHGKILRGNIRKALESQEMKNKCKRLFFKDFLSAYYIPSNQIALLQCQSLF